MKLLQIVQTLDPETGGVAPAVTSLSKALSQRAVEVEIVALDPPDAPWLRETSLHVHALGVGLTNYRYSPKLLPWLRENRSRFDCIVVNGLWQYLSFAAWRAFAASGTPYFVFPHGMLDPWFKVTYPRKHLKKWLYWPWADYRVLRDAAAVIFTSEEERLQARKSFWLYRARERISPLGIEPFTTNAENARELFLNRFPQLRGKPFLLFLGRLHPKKGCDLLIDAFGPRRDNATLVLAGPDQIGWRRELEQRIAGLRMGDAVVFTGMLEGEVKHGALAAAEAFVLPSHQENFGLSVVEALAAGVPVLISNRVNIWREIESDAAGYIENDDADGVRRLLTRWFDTGESTRSAIRANARACFARRFEINRAAESLLAILNEPLAAK